jgi:pimeloyl-ACP methyl ester carboxylesterase
MKVCAGLIGLALLVAIYYVGVNWQPDVPVEALRARWAPPPSSFVTLDSISVHLRDEGPRDDPQPLLLLHGTSASLHTWEGWSTLLRAHHRVISVDLPGFGLTGPFADDDYRSAHYIAFLEDLLKALGIEHCVVAGNSFGGELAWQLAVADPDRVVGLILVDAAGYPLKSSSTPIGFRLARMPLVSNLMQNVLPRAVVRSSVRNVYGDPSKVSDDLVDRYFEMLLRAGNRRALVAHFAVYRSGDDSAQIVQVRTPTLILWGGRDRLNPPANAERFAHDIPHSRVVLFPTLGHVPHEEDAASTAAAAATFLDSLGQAAPAAASVRAP